MVRFQYSNKGYFTPDFESSANTICSALLALKYSPQTNPFTYGSAFISNHSPSSLVAFKLWPQQCGRWCEITAQVKFRSFHTEDLFDLGVKYPSKTCSSHLMASSSATNLKMITRQGVGGWWVRGILCYILHNYPTGVLLRLLISSLYGSQYLCVSA